MTGAGAARRVQALLLLLLASLAVLGSSAPNARAQELVADLSNHLVAITTGFAGTEVLLFGALESPGDVVVVVRGPTQSVTMHRKARVAGIWMNTASMTFESAPSFYAINASAPLEEISTPSVRQRHEMGLDALDAHLPRARASPNVAAEWRDALLRAKQRRGLYSRDVGTVTFLGARLFRSNIYFPSNVPTGSYTVDVFLLRDGRVVSAQTTPLIVSKVGVEADVFDFAHERSALYGFIAVLIALMAGWMAHTIFKKA